MARARKCDRCGCLYESYNVNSTDKEKFNAMILICLDDSNKYWGRNAVDVCPTCNKEFTEWWHKLGNEITGDKLEVKEDKKEDGKE